MVSWKYSFELVNREIELVKKKKQALDNLLANGKISQATYEPLNVELTEALADLEVNQKSLIEKMTARVNNLEKQINTLELFLANLEIHNVAGDIDEETYKRQSEAIILGLEAAKEEANEIKISLAKVSPLKEALKVSEAELEASTKAEAPETLGTMEAVENKEAIVEKTKLEEPSLSMTREDSS